jgi:AcrR family transcriptional regulator
MARRRRTPEQVKIEILAAAEDIIIKEGPDALRIKHVAEVAGMTHPTILHHFGSATGLLQALQHKFSRHIRHEFMDVLGGQPITPQLWNTLCTRLSDPKLGKMLCYLISEGIDPFPPVEEAGLSLIAEQLPGDDLRHKQHLILMVMYTMYGEGIFGSYLRERLGMEHTEETQLSFQKWIFSLILQR